MVNREKIVVLVDVDGTLASRYHGGVRKIRPSTLDALRALSEYAEVFLWSIAGSENGQRLLEEFPELEDYVSGSYGKRNFPKDKFDKVYCIDDEEIDEEVLSENHIILNDSYDGGEDNGLLLKAVKLIINWIVNDGV
ncbi:hypothetical protein J7M07_02840 [bacterium]|nr:hypothetical protein [bacterium]